jgi:hypothetical protein
MTGGAVNDDGGVGMIDGAINDYGRVLLGMIDGAINDFGA